MKRSILWFVPLTLACGPTFYEAPQPLGSYPDRLPAKSWKEVFRDVSPAPAGADAADQLFVECRDLAVSLPSLDGPGRLAAIDALLVRNRDGDFRLNVANFLHELRELVQLGVPWNEAEPLVRWRLEKLAEPAGFFVQRPSRQWDWDDAKWKEVNDAFDQEIAASAALFDPHLADAGSATRPFWLVQRAWFYFLRNRFDDADKDLEEVTDKFASHPRAEVARLLSGRCALERSRAVLNERGARNPDTRSQEQWNELSNGRDLADERFTEYRKLYPKGRYVADVAGWQAAVASDRDMIFRAVELQLERLDLQPTREVKRSVLKECDRLFADWTLKKGQDMPLPYPAMAKHPEVSRLFLQRVIDPAGSGADDALRHALAGGSLLVNRAVAGLAEAVAFDPEARMQADGLLVLGWSCLRNDQPGQARVLFDRALEGTTTDDLLQGKAVALARMGNHAEAVFAYEELERRFPQSPLVVGSLFERAVSRFRSGHAGEALADLWQLQPLPGMGSSEPVTVDESRFLRDEGDVAQWIDTIEQFAPSDQLVAFLATLPPEDARAERLRAVVRSRALAAEDLELAHRHLDPAKEGEEPAGGEPAEETGAWSHWGAAVWLPMNAKRWEQDVFPIESAGERLAALPKGHRGQARAHLMLARAWRDARGHVTLPFWQSWMMNSERQLLDVRRRANAGLLGIPAAQIDREIESRDELDHALRHYLAAAELAKDPETAVEALEGANEALFRLAEFSPYRASRAAETDATALSRKLVERLRKEFPDRPEAKRAVAWTFVPPSMMGAWMPGDYVGWRCEEMMGYAVAGIRGSLFERTWSLDDETSFAGREGKPKEILQALRDLAGSSLPLAEMREKLAAQRQTFTALRPEFSEAAVNGLAGLFDDLALAAAVPGVSDDLFRSFARARLTGDSLQAENGWEPFEPFVAYAALARQAVGEAGVETRIAAWQAYLDRFPNGPKTEAASLQKLRLMVRAECPVPKVNRFSFPQAPMPDGYKRMAETPRLDDETAKALLDAVAAHEARFPNGRYQADISLLRAAAALGAGDADLTVAKLTEVLRDPSHRELHGLAARYLADCGLRLLDPSQRVTFTAAFRAHPDSKVFLRNLAEGDTCVSRIRPLLTWLDQS